jgi:hypothetical protein
VFLDNRVHHQGVDEVHGSIRDGAKEIGRAGGDELATVFVTKVTEKFLLLVIEIGLNADTRRRFLLGHGGGAEMKTVILGPKLQRDSLRDRGGAGKPLEEIAE